MRRSFDRLGFIPIADSSTFQPTPMIGREAELATLSKLLAEPHCRLLTITGWGYRKDAPAVELASSQQSLFPAVSIMSPSIRSTLQNSSSPPLPKSLGSPFRAAAPQDQLLNYLTVRTDKTTLLVLDNLEHLLIRMPEQEGTDETTLLISKLLQRLPNLKILATSRERSNLQGNGSSSSTDCPFRRATKRTGWRINSAVALYLQRARQMEVDFEVLPDDRPWLARICQLVEGAPLRSN